MRLGSYRFRRELESEGTIRHARYFWIITAALVAIGVLLISGAKVAGLGPIALVCGVLLLWSGVVKVVVLRIWRATLSADPVPDHADRDERSAKVIGQRT